MGSLRVSALSATAYILYEPVSGTVVEGANIHRQMTMASTTKIMTGLLLCEAGELEKTVEVTEDMIRVEGTSIGLAAGDVVSRRTLLYGLLLESGNDAANVIAVALAGDLNAFAECMNQKAKSLGMNESHFVTPSGLDADGHYTTAYDMALLASAAMQNEEFAKAAGTQTYRAQYNGGETIRTYSNHNRLLGQVEGMEGIKTGFTKKSGRCLVTSCTRDGLRLIAVTLNAPDDWQDHKTLYSRGFSRFESVTVGTEFLLPKIPVAGGGGVTVSVAGGQTVVHLLPEDTKKLSYTLELPPFLYAPIKKGEVIGQMKCWLNGRIVGRADFLAGETAYALPPEKISWSEKWWLAFCRLLAN